MHQGYTANLKFTNLIFHYILLSLIGSPTYSLSKKIINILAPLVGNTEFHVRNSSDFVESITNLRLEVDEILVSFDVVSLFTNIPTTLAVEIAKKRLTECNDFQERTNWSIQDVCEGLNICMQSSYSILHSEESTLNKYLGHLWVHQCHPFWRI